MMITEDDIDTHLFKGMLKESKEKKRNFPGGSILLLFVVVVMPLTKVLRKVREENREKIDKYQDL